VQHLLHLAAHEVRREAGNAIVGGLVVRAARTRGAIGDAEQVVLRRAHDEDLDLAQRLAAGGLEARHLDLELDVACRIDRDRIGDVCEPTLDTGA